MKAELARTKSKLAQVTLEKEHATLALAAASNASPSAVAASGGAASRRP